MNILFTDKTGTLTEGVLSVGCAVLGNGQDFPTLRLWLPARPDCTPA